MLVVKSDAERYVMGEVYIPWDEDAGREFMTDADVRKMAHDFIGRGLVQNIDVMHGEQPTGNVVAESFIVRHANDPDGFRKGAWVVGAYIKNDEDWRRVLKGELNGWSWGGSAKIVPVLCTVGAIVAFDGTTELWPALSGESGRHHHTVSGRFDANGKLIPCVTGPAVYEDGSDRGSHTHNVVKITGTVQTDGHGHRIVIVEEE